MPNSQCCNKPLKVDGGDEGTRFYVCERCEKPSDPRRPDVLQNPKMIALSWPFKGPWNVATEETESEQ